MVDILRHETPQDPVRPPVASLARARRLVSEAEFESNRQRIAAAYGFATVLPLVFGVFDVIRKIAGAGHIDLGIMLSARVVSAGFAAIGWWRLRRADTLTRRELNGWVNVLAPSLSVFIVVLCLGGPGIDSMYPNAAGMVACVFAFVPRRYTRVIGSAVATVLAFPATFFIAAPFWDRAAEEIAAPRFGYLLTVSTSILAAIVGVIVYASHLTWAMRREVFEARTIGRYRVKELLGEGGMGEVWRAFDTTLRRDVALKVLRCDHGDETAKRRFEREVRATIELTHPNTIRVFDYGVTSDGLSYYAMELLPGMTLGELLAQEKRLSCARAVHFALSAARALAEAHARGIVHRDIKPENLFVTRAGDEPDFLKVLDFGVARLLEGGEQLSLTGTGQLAGTPMYIAPEVLSGAEAGYPADVYSLGVVLYQMLTGRSPYALQGRAPVHMLASMTTPPTPPSEYVAVPPELEAILMRCLAKRPEDRFPDARALAAALAGIAVSAEHHEVQQSAMSDTRELMMVQKTVRG